MQPAPQTLRLCASADSGCRQEHGSTLTLVIWQPRGLGIGWGYYFKVGAVLTLPVLLITLAALAFRLSVGA